MIRALRAAWAMVEAERRLWQAERLLRERPTGHLLEAGHVLAAARDPVPPAALAEARRLGAAIERAARLGMVRPKCLVRSIALAEWLRDRGVPGVRLRLGSRRTAGRFEAHAWVEVGGEIVGDHQTHVASFAPLADAVVEDP